MLDSSTYVYQYVFAVITFFATAADRLAVFRARPSQSWLLLAPVLRVGFGCTVKCLTRLHTADLSCFQRHRTAESFLARALRHKGTAVHYAAVAIWSVS